MDIEISEKLCCPVCRGKLSSSMSYLSCKECSLAYPILQGRPVLVPAVAQKGAGAATLIAAAAKLPQRSQVPQSERARGVKVEDFFFKCLFPQFNRRDPHWTFLGRKVSEMVDSIPPGAAVMDIGAGECKYASLLSHARYVGGDLVTSSGKHDFSRLDVVADALAIPFQDAVFDAALNLVVLEHVPDPALAIREMARILKPGASAFALIPLVRPEHLAPFDFQRLTRYGIQALFENNGFRIESVEGSNGALWTAVNYAALITMTRPLVKYGRRSLRGLFWNRFWFLVLWPMVIYARISDRQYGGEFPIYFWVKAKRLPGSPIR